MFATIEPEATRRPQGANKVLRRIGVILIGVAVVIISILLAVLAFIGTAAVLPNAFAMYGAALLVGIGSAYGLSLLALQRTRRRRSPGALWSRRTSTSAVIAGVSAAALVAATVTFTIPVHPGQAFPADVEGTQFAELTTGSRVAWWKTEAKEDSGKPPIVFLHGGPGSYVNGTMPLFDALADEGRDIYYFDQVGAGHSSLLPADEYSIERLIDDLEAFRIEVVDADKISLIGHSFGGFYAEAYATNHPESVDQVALVNPLNYSQAGMTDAEIEAVERPPLPEEDTPSAASADLLSMLKLGIAGPLIGINPAAGTAFMSQEEQLSVMSALLERDGGLSAVANLGVGASSEAIVEDVMTDITETALPTLVVRNEFDYVVWPSLRLYRDLNPNATMVFVPGLRHEDIDADDLAVYEPVRAFFAGEELDGVYDGEEDPYFFFSEDE